jgi:hypothetical protein
MDDDDLSGDDFLGEVMVDLTESFEKPCEWAVN